MVKFGNIDDIIRATEDEVHKLYCILCDIAWDIEILRFKKRAPPAYCVKEFPPILYTLYELEEMSKAEQNKMSEAKERLSRLQFEREFIKLKKRMKQKK